MAAEEGGSFVAAMEAVSETLPWPGFGEAGIAAMAAFWATVAWVAAMAAF